jgi:hypothetical protein
LARPLRTSGMKRLIRCTLPMTLVLKANKMADSSCFGSAAL